MSAESEKMNSMAWDILHEAEEAEKVIAEYESCRNRYCGTTDVESKKSAANSTYEAIDQLCKKRKELMSHLEKASAYGKENGGLFIVGLIYDDLLDRLKHTNIEEAFVRDLRQIHMDYIDITYDGTKTAQDRIRFCDGVDKKVKHSFSGAVEEILEYGKVFRIDCRMQPCFVNTECNNSGKRTVYNVCKAAEDLRKEAISCLLAVSSRDHSYYYRDSHLNKLIGKIYVTKSTICELSDNRIHLDQTYWPLLGHIVEKYCIYLNKTIDDTMAPFMKDIELDAVDLTVDYIPEDFEEKLEEMKVAIRILEYLLIKLFSLQTVEKKD